MAEYSVKDYEMFNQLITISNSTAYALCSFNEVLTNSKSLLSDGTVMMGPIADDAKSTIEEFSASFDIMVDNVREHNISISKILDIYQNADKKAGEVVSGGEGSSTPSDNSSSDSGAKQGNIVPGSIADLFSNLEILKSDTGAYVGTSESTTFSGSGGKF